MMKKNEWLRGVSFLLAAALVFHILTIIFVPKWYGTWQSTRIVDGFYEMPKDSIDVALLGSSQTIMGLSAMELYRQYGISAYGLGTEEQPLYATYYWLKEILRCQKPAVAVLDINELIHESSEAAYRKAFDYMRWSEVKWEAVKAHCEEEGLSLFSYVLPLVQYHSRWDELEGSDFAYLLSDKTDPFLGSVILAGECEIPYGGITANPEIEPEPAMEKAYAYLLKIIQLCREEGMELLLVKTPRAGWNVEKHNLAAQIAREQGVPFLDFNDEAVMAAMGFNYSKDARDGSHLNIYGAEKVGAYLGAYLTARYDLRDCRESGACPYLAEMLSVYELQAENAKLRTCVDFPGWLARLKSRYIVFLVSDGPLSARELPENLTEILCRMGAEASLLKSDSSYGAVLQMGAERQGNGQAGGFLEGKALAWQSGTGFLDLKGVLEDGASYQVLVSLPGEGEEMKHSICLGTVDYAVGGEGLHFVAYDPVRQDVVDSIWVDTGTPELILNR